MRMQIPVEETQNDATPLPKTPTNKQKELKLRNFDCTEHVPPLQFQLDQSYLLFA